MTCPLCRRQAPEREFIIAGETVRMIECDCVPADKSPVSVRLDPDGTVRAIMFRA